MRSIKGVLTPELERHVKDEPIHRADAFPVLSFRQLVEHVAHLAYLNKDHLLFFRGQPRDYRNKAGSSTIYPSIYRGERVPKEQLELSFAILESAGSRLADLFEQEGLSSHRDVRRRRYIQWSILQHYQVCDTPLLDLTQSLRVACSFAHLSAGHGEPYVMVFGMPYMTNRISVNSEHDLVNIRLLSICPPEALRPYFQEGYLAGTDEVLMEYESKSELDFNNRLVAKFVLQGPRSRFWRHGFRPYPQMVLYPRGDKIKNMCDTLKSEVEVGATPGRIGKFLQEWTSLENRVMDVARAMAGTRKIHSLRSALDLLARQEVVSEELMMQMHRLRRVRNEIVHRPERVERTTVAQASAEVGQLTRHLAKEPPWVS